MSIIGLSATIAAIISPNNEWSQQPYTMGVTTSALNIRKGNSTAYDTEFVVSEGTVLEIIESKNGWYKVRCEGKMGWAYSGYVNIEEEEGVIKYVTGIQRLSLRSESLYNVNNFLGYIYEGEKVEVLEYKGDFARIRYKNKMAYVDKNYFTDRSNSVNMYVSKITRLSLRAEASSRGKFLGYAYEGEQVEVVGYSGEFAHVVYKGKRYFVMKKYLVLSNPIEYRYVKNIKKLTVRNSPDTSELTNIVDYIPEGQRVKVLSHDGKFDRIQYGAGKNYFVIGEYLSISSERVVFGANKVNIRKEMSISSQVVGSIEFGERIEVFEEIDNWVKVKSGDVFGYINKRYIADSKYIDGLELVSIRTSPTTKDSSNFLGHIKKGMKVYVLDYYGLWAKIKYGDREVYVLSKYLSNSSDKAVEYINVYRYKPDINTRYANKEGVKVYRNPQSSDELLGYLEVGDNIQYIAHLDDVFSEVKLNNKIVGYIKNQDLTYRNPNAKNTEKIDNKYIDMTHSEYVNTQKGKPYVSIEDVSKYSNPNTFSMDNREEKYQFLKINKFSNVNVYQLNEYLNNLPVKPGNVAIFENQAQAFIDAARAYDIDPIYLVAHTMLETGYGSSTLAQGVIVSEDAAGNKVDPVRVHNLFGIGAIDSDAVGGGSKTAYALGWTTIPDAIKGAAMWISEGVKSNPSVGLKASAGYIHSSRHTQQYTLYSMRWDYVLGWHQYATDPRWPLKISRLMSKMDYMYEGADLVFEKILYKAEEKSEKLYAPMMLKKVSASKEIVGTGSEKDVELKENEDSKDLDSNIKDINIKKDNTSGSLDSEVGSVIKEEIAKDVNIKIDSENLNNGKLNKEDGEK